MPKSVVIFGRTIPIKYLSQKQIDKIIPGAFGVWDPEHYCIYMMKEQSRVSFFRTLRHEVGHAVKTITGLDQVLPPELQEIIVQTFAGLIEDVQKQAAKFR